MARPVAGAGELADTFKTVVVALGVAFAAVVFVLLVVIAILVAIVGFGP